MVPASGGHAGERCLNRVEFAGGWCGKCRGVSAGGQRAGAGVGLASQEYVIDRIIRGEDTLDNLAHELRTDRNFVLRSVSGRGEALRFAENCFRDDVGVVLAAVRNNDF
eukprot:4733282-Pyramimonas_sp.AAC.1